MEQKHEHLEDGINDLIHCQMRINHFKFWILSAIEWRINEMMTYLKQLKEDCS